MGSEDDDTFNTVTGGESRTEHSLTYKKSEFPNGVGKAFEAFQYESENTGECYAFQRSSVDKILLNVFGQSVECGDKLKDNQ